MEGPGKILVRVFREEHDPQGVVVEVADTGPGISGETMEKIFDPFVTTKTGENAGLGLSVCYGLVQSCGGEITLAEEKGFGTVIKIRLPVSGPEGQKG